VIKLRSLTIAAAFACLAACGPAQKEPAHAAASSSQAAPADAAPAQAGSLKVWVPASMWVPARTGGAHYWIYVDGHIAGGPPHEAMHPYGSSNIVVVKSDGGWEITNAQGVVLSMAHENWDNRLDGYVNSNLPDPLHIFEATEIPLPPGTYTIQGMMQSQPGENGFPFVLTRTDSVEVRPGQATQLYMAVPDSWADPGLAAFTARQIRAFCPTTSAAPDFNELQSQASEYLDDPMVKLRASEFFRARAVAACRHARASGGGGRSARIRRYGDRRHRPINRVQEFLPEPGRNCALRDRISRLRATLPRLRPDDRRDRPGRGVVL
jgi:hypothetical protein